MAVENATGEKALVAASAVTAYRRVSMNSSGQVAHAAAGVLGVGISAKTIGSGDHGTINLWSKAGTEKVTAAGAFSAGDVLYPAADGKFDDVENGTGVMVAMEAATADGDIVEAMPLPSLQQAAPTVGSAASALCANDLVYVSTYTGEVPTVTKAQGTSGGIFAQYIVPVGAACGGDVVLVARRQITGANTNAGAVGDPVYLSDATAGGWTLTKPTATDKVQIVGRIAVKSATVGVIEIQLPGQQQIVHTHASNAEGGALEAGQVGGAAFENNSGVDTTGGPLLTWYKAVTASAGTTIVALARKVRIIDAYIRSTAAGKNQTITLKNGNADTIVGAMTLSCTDNTITRAAVIDDAYADVACGCALVAVASAATAGLIVVTGIPVA